MSTRSVHKKLFLEISKKYQVVLYVDKQMLEKVFCSNIVSFFEIQKNVFMNLFSEHPTPGSVMPLAICFYSLDGLCWSPLSASPPWPLEPISPNKAFTGN